MFGKERIALFRFLRLRTLLVFVLGITSLQAWAQNPPVMRKVTTDPATGEIEIKWDGIKDESSFEEYCIEWYVANVSNVVFTTPKTGAITYTVRPTSSFPSNTVNLFKVNTLNQGETAPGENSPASRIHSTFIITIINTYNSCDETLSMSWTKYQAYDRFNEQVTQETKDFNAGVKYEVWGYPTAPSDNSFNPALAIKLAITDTDNNATFGVVPNQKYFLFVKALLPNGEEATCYRAEAITPSAALPTDMSIDSVIDKKGSIRLAFKIDLNSANEVDTFRIKRSENFDGPYQTIYQFHDKNLSSYVNTGTEAGKEYFYQLAAVKCREERSFSDTANNIVPQALISNNTQVNLSWNEFVYPNPVYHVYLNKPIRKHLGDVSTNSFTDLTSINDYPDEIEFCYSIEAEETVKPTHSISYEVCVSNTPQILMPNAIDPDSPEINPSTQMQRNRFGPYLSVKSDSYRLELDILNRWGNLLFSSKKDIGETLNINTHFWDGTHKGAELPEGVYVYHVTITFSDGTSEKKQGIVTLIRANL